MPKVSVVIPVYNVERYIEQCLDSVLSQTFTDIEVIIVNDKSPDNCAKIIQDYAKKDRRIKVLEHQVNRGLRSAVFTGLEQAKAEFVTFVDSDDWLKDTHVETLYNMVVEKNADLGVVGFYYYAEEKYKQVFLGQTRIYTKDEIEQEVLTPFFEQNEYLIHNIQNSRWGKMYKTELLKKAVVGANTKLIMGEDGEINVRYISLCERIAVEANKASYCYRGDNSGAMTKRYNLKRLLQNDIYIEELKKIAKLQNRPGKALGYDRDVLAHEQLFIYLNAYNGYNDKVACVEKILAKVGDKSVILQKAEQSIFPVKIGLKLIANGNIKTGVFMFQIVVALKNFFKKDPNPNIQNVK